MSRPTFPAGKKRWAVAASAALAASAVSAVPASGTIGAAGVQDGHSITTFHNIDFVALTGYPETATLDVQVVRNGVTIGSVNAPALPGEVAGEFGLEINHGPEGDVRPGDCWDVTTPDIRPGDHIVVNDGVGTDEVVVDDIRFTGQPFLARNGDVLVDGVARQFNGPAIPLAQLDSAEFRDGSAFRIFANEVRLTRRAGEVGGFRLRYPIRRQFERNRDNRTPAQIQQTLLTVDGHAMGFGHIEPPPADAQLVEGLGDTPGPAPGCAAPSAQWAVSSVTPASLNTRNRNRAVTVRGVSQDATEVRVDLTDAAGTVVSKTAQVAGTGPQNWTVRFTAAERSALDGEISVAGFYTLADGEIGGGNATLLKDLVRPNAPRTSLRAGTYRRAKRVALRAAAGEQIRYTLGNGRQARPTLNRGNVYDGQRIRITSTQVLKVVAIDDAGNVSPVTRVRYRIANVPSRPRIRRAFSGRRGGRDTAVARWAAPRVANGARVTGYRVVALKMRRNGNVALRRGSRRLSAGARTMEMRLPRGQYRFRVRALSNNGSTALSPRSNIARSR